MYKLLSLVSYIWYNIISFHVFDVVFPDMPPVSPTTGRVEGEVKLSVSYRNSTLFIMVMHIKDLVRNDDSICLPTDP